MRVGTTSALGGRTEARRAQLVVVDPWVKPLVAKYV
jgi:hypothetical protein